MTSAVCTPDPPPSDDYWPSDRIPTPFAVRQAEIEDLRGQGAGPLDIWTATTITAEEYL